MDIVNPDGSKAEVKPEAEAKVEAKAEEALPTFKADFNTPGWMKLELNLEAISHDRKAQWMLMGFMDDHKAIAMTIVGKIIEQRNSVRAALQKTQSKNGFRGFLDKIQGR